MEFSASRDSTSASTHSLTAQNANLSRENGVPNKSNADLLESLKQLSGKVKNLFNKEQIKDLLEENEKVEKMLLDDSTTLMSKLCTTENGTTDEHTENIPRDESAESVAKVEMEVTGQLESNWSKLTEQITNVQKLQSDLNAKTAQLEQVTNDLRLKNTALEETAKTLRLEKEQNIQRQELNKREVKVYKCDIKSLKSDLVNLRTENIELLAELEIANEKIAKSEDNLKKVEKENGELLVKIGLLEAAEDTGEVKK